MTDEQKAAFIISQAAVLSATVAGMVAENMQRQHRGESIAYDESSFEAVYEESGCTHNQVVGFFQ